MTSVAPLAGTTGLPLKRQASDMTWWSRYDCVRMPAGPTDHWSKMKLRSSTICVTKSPDGRLKVVKSAEAANRKTVRFQQNTDGTVSRVPGEGNAVFGAIVKTDAGESYPGSYTMQRPRTRSRTSLRTSFNERARQGFKYWPQDRPKPTSFGRYGIGSYKTVLGLGNAPRT